MSYLKNTHYFRALSKDKKKLVDFTLKDGVCQLDDNTLFLMKRSFSPLISRLDIFRGTPDGKLYEGDIILDESENLYIVHYEEGFVAKRGEVSKKLIDIKEIRKVGSCLLEDCRVLGNRPKIYFKCEDIVFTFANMYGLFEDGSILINKNNWTNISIVEIKQDSGVILNREICYFGDKTNKGTVRMRNGEVKFDKF